MARKKALPRIFGRIHRRYQTPDVSTLVMGVISVLWYVGLTLVSEDVLADSLAALGLMIAFYYGLTGLACVIYFRRELTKSVKNFFYIGVLPFLGFLSLGYIFVRSAKDLSAADYGESGAVLGIGVPFVIGIGGLLLGVVLMIFYNGLRPEFFRTKREVADPHLLDEPKAA